ncbi:MAG: hypothetical protein ACYSSN_06080 [Planctomycetota bacterium]
MARQGKCGIEHQSVILSLIAKTLMSRLAQASKKAYVCNNFALALGGVEIINNVGDRLTATNNE